MNIKNLIQKYPIRTGIVIALIALKVFLYSFNFQGMTSEQKTKVAEFESKEIYKYQERVPEDIKDLCMTEMKKELKAARPETPDELLKSASNVSCTCILSSLVSHSEYSAFEKEVRATQQFMDSMNLHPSFTEVMVARCSQ